MSKFGIQKGAELSNIVSEAEFGGKIIKKNKEVFITQASVYLREASRVMIGKYFCGDFWCADVLDEVGVIEGHSIMF